MGAALKGSAGACRPLSRLPDIGAPAAASGTDHSGAIRSRSAAPDFLLLARRIRYAQRAIADAAGVVRATRSGADRVSTMRRSNWACRSRLLRSRFPISAAPSSRARTAEPITRGAATTWWWAARCRAAISTALSHARAGRPDDVGNNGRWIPTPRWINMARRWLSGSAWRRAICRQFSRTCRTSPRRRSASWAERRQT